MMASMPPALPKLPGRATTEGQQYEYKLAALLNIRARRYPSLRYQIATNVAGAEPCDDVLIRLRWNATDKALQSEETAPRCLTYLIQLKHSRENKILDEPLLTAEKGDFSLKKYFEVYRKLSGDELLDAKISPLSKEFLTAHSSSDYRFIIYTTRILKLSPKEEYVDDSEDGKKSANHGREDSSDRTECTDEKTPVKVGRRRSSDGTAGTVERISFKDCGELVNNRSQISDDETEITNEKTSVSQGGERSNGGIVQADEELSFKCSGERSDDISDVADEKVFVNYMRRSSDEEMKMTNEKLTDSQDREGSKEIKISINNPQVSGTFRYHTSFFSNETNMKLEPSDDHSTDINIHNKKVLKYISSIGSDDTISVSDGTAKKTSEKKVAEMIKPKQEFINNEDKLTQTLVHYPDILSTVNSTEIPPQFTNSDFFGDKIVCDGEDEYLPASKAREMSETESKSEEDITHPTSAIGGRVISDPVNSSQKVVAEKPTNDKSSVSHGGLPDQQSSILEVGDKGNFDKISFDDNTEMSSPATKKEGIATGEEPFGLKTNWRKQNYGKEALMNIGNGASQQTYEKYPLSVDFPYIDFMSSIPGDVGYCFSKSDCVVWNMLNGHPNEESFKNEFLSRLRIFSSQRNAAELEDILIEEIQSFFSLGRKHSESVLREYLSVALKWWEDDAGSLWSEETTELEDILSKHLNSTFDLNLTQYELQFSIESCKEIEEKILQNRIVLLSTPGVSQVSKCIKIVEVFRLANLQILKLNQEMLKEMKNALFKVSRKLGENSVIFLDLINVNISVCDLVKKLAWEGRSKLVVATSNMQQCLQIMNDAPAVFHVMEDRWRLIELEEGSQKKLLNCTLEFQGRKMMLGDLESIWPTLRQDVDGAMMQVLLENNAVLGSDLKVDNEIEASYVTRTLCHRVILRPEILRSGSGVNRLALSGFPRHIIKKLKADMRKEHEDRVHSLQHNKKIKFSDIGAKLLLDEPWDVLSYGDENIDLEIDSKKFQNLNSDKKYKNIHHIAFVSGQILWIRTLGSSTHIVPFIEKACPNCAIMPICTHKDNTDFSGWKDKMILLTTEPGMGKSVLVRKMAGAGDGRQWHIVVHLINYVRGLQKMPSAENIRLDHVVDLLVSAVGVNGSSCLHSVRGFIKSSVEITGHITVYVDGVDEVWTGFKEKVIKIIELLRGSKVSRVWVTCRQYLEKELKGLFSYEPFHLKPFSYEEQVGYVSNFVSRTTGQNERSCAAEIVSDVLKEIQTYSEITGQSICDVPLHVNIIAQSYTETAKNIKDTQKEKSISLLGLYQDFVESKLSIFKEKFGFDDNVKDPRILNSFFIKMHENFALMVMNDLDDIVSDRDLQRSLKKHIRLLKEENTGIVNFADGLPQFAHYSFAEFFMASWLKENYRDEMSEKIWRKMSPMLRFFLNAMLCNEFPLHEAAISGNVNQVKMALEKSGKEACRLRDNGGRCPIHLAAMLNHEKVCRFLLEAGSDLHEKDAVLSWTPMEYADSFSHLGIIDYFLSFGGNKNELKETIRLNGIDGTIFRRAAAEGYINVVQMFIDARHDSTLSINDKGRFCNEAWVDEVGSTALHHAARHGHAHVAQLLIKESDSDVNSQMKDGKTALHLASRGGHNDVVELLIAHGASVNAADGEGETSLHAAAAWGQLSVVERLLGHGALVTAESNSKHTALHLAAGSGNDNIVDVLLRAGADVQAQTESGVTALALAAYNGHVKVLEVLVRAGALLDTQANSGASALHSAALNGQVSVASLLLDAGVMVDNTDRDKCTALHWGAWGGNVDFVESLLKSGATAEARDKKGATPLILATQNAQADIVQVLVEAGVAVETADDNGITPVHYAAANNHLEVLEMLLGMGVDTDVQDGDGATPLFLSAEEGLFDAMEMLVQAGADVNKADFNGNTPLATAAQHGHEDIIKFLLTHGADVNVANEVGVTPLLLASIVGNVTMAQLLLSSGADVNTTTSSGTSALNVAASEGHTKMVITLLLHGAEVDSIDEFTRTPFYWACAEGFSEIAEVLLMAGANINLPTGEGYTPLHIASQNGHEEIVTLLIKQGADRDCVNDTGISPLHLACNYGFLAVAEILISEDVKVDAVMKNSLTPLHLASVNGHGDIVRLLMDRGAAVVARTHDGRTAMHLSAQNGHVDIMAVLLENNGEVETSSEGGNTVLHDAAQFGHSEAVRFLLARGANVDAQTKDGETPLFFAAMRGHRSIVEILLSHGADTGLPTVNGATPLDAAIAMGNGGVARLLGGSVLTENGEDAQDGGIMDLHVVVSESHVNRVEQVLDAGESVDSPTVSGTTPLHVAAYFGHYGIVELLISHGASANGQRCDGWTPLHMAAARGHLEVAKALINSGVHLSVLTNNGETPLLLAVRNEQWDMVAYLLSEGADTYDQSGE